MWMRASGMLHLERAGRYEVMLGADENAELRLDGKPVASRSSGQFGVTFASASLSKGSHALEFSASDGGDVAHVLIDIYREGD